MEYIVFSYFFMMPKKVFWAFTYANTVQVCNAYICLTVENRENNNKRIRSFVYHLTKYWHSICSYIFSVVPNFRDLSGYWGNANYLDTGYQAIGCEMGRFCTNRHGRDTNVTFWGGIIGKPSVRHSFSTPLSDS